MSRFVEIMATVFSRDAWRCVWHMIQVYNSYLCLTNLFCLLYWPLYSLASFKMLHFLLQNDLVHGWGLDFALRKCVEVGEDFPFVCLYFVTSPCL